MTKRRAKKTAPKKEEAPKTTESAKRLEIPRPAKTIKVTARINLALAPPDVKDFIIINRGETVELPGDVAKRLLAQGKVMKG